MVDNASCLSKIVRPYRW